MGRPLVTSSPLVDRSGRRAERVPPGRKSWPPCSPAEESTVGTRPGRLPETGLSFQSGPPSEAIVRGRRASQGGDPFTHGSVSMVKGRTCWGSRSSPLPSLPSGLVGFCPLWGRHSCHLERNQVLGGGPLRSCLPAWVDLVFASQEGTWLWSSLAQSSGLVSRTRRASVHGPLTDLHHSRAQ